MPEPVLVSRAQAGVGTGESEQPRLVAGTDEAAKKALEALDKEFPGNSNSFVPAVTLPEPIKLESALQPR